MVLENDPPKRSLLFLKWVKKCIPKQISLLYWNFNHEIYDIRKSAEVIMHTIDPEDTYTIHIKKKRRKL
jgi:hypothetical protein